MEATTICLKATMGIFTDYHYFQTDSQMQFTEKNLIKQGFKVTREKTRPINETTR